MAIGFNIQFRINEKTQSRVIRLTDTSTGFTFAKGNFSIVHPDGSSLIHTDFDNPDISSSGAYYEFQASTDIYNNVLTGQYTITFVAKSTSLVEYTLARTFDFNWIKPAADIQNRSDVFIPQVQFFDNTSYTTIGSFTGTLTRTFSVPFPSTSEVPSQPTVFTSTNTLTPVYSSKYYEGLYNTSLDVTVNYTHAYSWLTIYYTNLSTKTFDIRQVPNQVQLVTKLNTFRAVVDSYREKNDTQFEILSEEYDIAIALYSHLVARFQTGTLDGSQPLLEELLSILEPYGGAYTYKATQLTPFVLNESGGQSFNISDGANLDVIPMQSTLTFASGNPSFNILVADNSVTYTPIFGSTTNTFAAGNDARFHNSVTIGTANGLSLSTQVLSLAVASSGSAGAMSAADKVKLDGVATGATANVGTVTSVGISMPSAFTVTGSPVTVSGTLTVVGAGSALQYIKGDGGLATLNTAAVAESTNLYFTTGRSRSSISLTTSGTSGASTYNPTTGVLNIPQYTGNVTSFNTRTGDIVLSSSDVTTALTFTPENAANKGIANGYASLDGGGLIPATQLPSYVDDVLEYTNLAGFPATGTTGKIYVALDTNKIYRWSGSTYIEVSPTVGTIWGGITGTLSNQTDLQTALNGKYNVPTGTTAQYIAGDGSLITFPVAGQSGTIVRLVRNTTGATLTKGTVVYISGATGNNPIVAKALATSDSTSAQTFGLCQTDIANNATGYVVSVGDLIGLDTSAFTEGQQLYLSSTVAGTYTATKQYAPAHLVYIGVITRSHPTLGQIEVRIQNGYEMDELHNVSAQTPSNNDGIFWESSTSLWKNKSIATVLGYTPVDATSGTTNYVPKFTGANTLGNSNIQDSGSLITLGNNTTISSGGLGIGTTSLTGYSLSIAKNATGSTNYYNVYQNGIVQSDVTNRVHGFASTASTAASTFTLTTYYHFTADQGTIGSGSAITTQIGYHAGSSMSGATNNWGFRGALTSGTNRYNLYMDGTANNYLAGDTSIGTTTLGTATKLTIGGSETAVSAISRGQLINTTLVAAANNDFLVGMDINPTFTNGTFTGVTNYGLRVNNGLAFINDRILIANYTGLYGGIVINSNRGYSQNSSITVHSPSSGNNNNIYEASRPSTPTTIAVSHYVGTDNSVYWNTTNTAYNFLISSTQVARLNTTGNLLLQNGGTFTDAGYRLDVNGTFRQTGSTTASSALAVGSTITPTLVAAANNDVLVGMDINPTFTNGAFTGVSNIGLRLINSLAASTDIIKPSPQLFFSGTQWNSSLGSTRMSAAIQVNSYQQNVNPTISKLSFLVGTDNATPTEQLYITSNGLLGSNGGAIFSAGSGSYANDINIIQTTPATSAVAYSSNRLVLRGTAWNSGQGYKFNMGYLQMINFVNNANPTTDKLSFFVGSADNANSVNTAGNATERLALRTDGIFSFFNSSTTEILRLFNTGNLLIQNGGTFTDAGYKLDVVGTTRISGVTTLSNLTGTGYRIVVAAADGTLSASSALSGYITGSGTTNYVPKFTSASAIGNSLIYDNGTNVGIGTTSPLTKLQINDTNPVLTFYANNAGVNSKIIYIQNSSGDFTFAKANDAYDTFTSLMRLTSAGNLGLGTTSPESLTNQISLSIKGTSYARLDLYDSTNKNMYLYGGSGYAVVGATSSATNGLQFEVNGATRATISTSGNLGLGVTPSAWDSSFKAIQIGTYAALSDNSGGGGGFSLFGNSYEYGVGTYKYLNNYYATQYRTYAGQHQWFNAPSGTAGTAISFTQAMTLNASGNLLIGTTTDSGYKLDVNGTTRINNTLTVVSSSNTSAGTIELGTSIYKGILDYSASTGLYKFNNQTAGSSITDYFQFQADGTSVLNIKKSGAATFSSSVTATTLTANGGYSYLYGLRISGADTGNTIYQPTGDFSISSDGGNIRLLTNLSTANIIFGTNTTERMRITSSGNVGIGTTSPSGKLEVSSGYAQFNGGGIDGTLGEAILFGNTTYSTVQKNRIRSSISAATNGNLLVFESGTATTGTYNNYQLSLSGNGNVGIGTASPAYKLDINSLGYGIQHYGDASNNIRTYAGSGYQILEANGTNQFGYFGGNFFIQTLGTERMRITSGGNVLIGTTTDSGYKLDVNGSIRGTSTLTLSGVANIYQASAARVLEISGNNNAQGNANWFTIVRSYPVVSSGTQLIIPITSQVNLNSTTLVRIMGHSSQYNVQTALGFSAYFSFGHTNSISNLTSWGLGGNVSSISISGMNIIVAFTTAYTSATANGIYATIEYMTNVPAYSINVSGIAMN